MSVTLPPPLAAFTDDDAVALLREYYGSTYLGAGCYTGVFFDSWAPRNREVDADRFTADDLIAVTFLSVDVSARAAREILVTRADEFAELLAAVGPDHDLVDDVDALTRDSPLWRLETTLLSIKYIGRTKATKLMARKRPRLVPIYDVVVGEVLKTTLSHHNPIREALRADGGALDARLRSIRTAAGLPDDISALRVLGVISWVWGKSE
ncbi:MULTISPECIES: DUF6308 family protein [unclassified Rhodococcus (in: high G+C Gram-positive bacteria)]|uniref:DUF6308 family protein n=1 Tax=unclassified Rhodococcus (in: high G+C Gram-positive bacteria) TaxID=192944 RepID=UPI0006F5C597|nr:MULTISPECIES: DUF6308 family protein [unclassified Rhodococcus (in: high G+C Gram-positive bacteria)]KQU28408.1 hypothetical protein ASG69_10360 [Rhodococcus sp. Leaf225]KQU46514.1 hypothetical protein ASH03_07390 [Rhodococcus sp. Leaf258]